MGKLKRFSCKQQLTIMFAAMVFLFMFFAMLIVFLGAFLLYRLGLVGGRYSGIVCGHQPAGGRGVIDGVQPFPSGPAQRPDERD